MMSHGSTPLTLAIAPDLNLQVTPEQFASLARTNTDLRLERTAQGDLIVNPPTGWETGKRNSNLNGELYLWWRNAGRPGHIFDSSTGFTLPNRAVRSPDASWVSDERWNARKTDPQETFARVCPEFVVELRSGSDRLPPLQAKMREYINNGTQLGWLLSPQNRTVEIYRGAGETERLTNPKTLSGETTLSGFALELSWIW